MNEEQITGIFSRFTELLDDRFSKNVFSTEDSIRYTFFYALTEQTRINPDMIILEYPHPQIEGARIDALVSPQDADPVLLEFKFHREIPSNLNSNRSQKAGSLFADIFRLTRYKLTNKRSHCYFVYVTDREMRDYCRNKNNRLGTFFDLNVRTKLAITKEYIQNKSETFEMSAGNAVESVIECIAKEDFKSGFSVRIYEIVLERGSIVLK